MFGIEKPIVDSPHAVSVSDEDDALSCQYALKRYLDRRKDGRVCPSICLHAHVLSVTIYLVIMVQLCACMVVLNLHSYQTCTCPTIGRRKTKLRIFNGQQCSPASCYI